MLNSRGCLCALVGAAVAATLALAPGDAVSAGVGATCGGFVGKRCDKGLWCDPRPGFCKGADIQGHCKRTPQVCFRIWRPVCGCDGKTYGNDCERVAKQVAKHHDGRCK